VSLSPDLILQLIVYALLLAAGVGAMRVSVAGLVKRVSRIEERIDRIFELLVERG